MRLAPLILFLAISCHPQPIPTVVDMTVSTADMGEYGLPFCALDMNVSFSDVCDGMFTTSGLACYNCTGAAVCLDTIDVVYCAKGKRGCLDDDACIHIQDGSEGAPTASKKSIRKIPPKIKKPKS